MLARLDPVVAWVDITTLLCPCIRAVIFSCFCLCRWNAVLSVSGWMVTLSALWSWGLGVFLQLSQLSLFVCLFCFFFSSFFFYLRHIVYNSWLPGHALIYSAFPFVFWKFLLAYNYIFFIQWSICFANNNTEVFVSHTAICKLGRGLGTFLTWVCHCIVFDKESF